MAGSPTIRYKELIEMDRQILLRKIMGVNNEVRRLEQDISALQSMDVIDYPDSYSMICQPKPVQLRDFLVQLVECH